MTIMKHVVVTQKAVVLLCSLLLHFISLPSKKLGGPDNTKALALLMFLIANDKRFN